MPAVRRINFRRSTIRRERGIITGGIGRRTGIFDNVAVYDLLQPQTYQYTVTITMTGTVPQRMVVPNTSYVAQIPDMEQLAAEAMVHCFETQNPRRGYRRDFGVQLTDLNPDSDEDSDFAPDLIDELNYLQGQGLM